MAVSRKPASKTMTEPVDLPTGASVRVKTADEADFLNKSRDRYLSETRFTDNTDLQDLDRLLLAELLLFRYNAWMMAGVDYDDERFDEIATGRKIKDVSDSINRLKEQMGLSKKARDASAASIADKWNELLRRAKEFGYHRENQMRTAMVLMAELSTIVGSFDRSDEEERRKLGYETEHDILMWVREYMLPEYRRVDEHFIANEQRMWQRGG